MRHQLAPVGDQSKLIALTKLGEIVRETKAPIDEKFTDDMPFELVGVGPTTDINFAGRHSGALAMYQVKAACGSKVDITGTETLIKIARSGNEKRAPGALSELLEQVNGLNQSIRSSNMEQRGFIVRSFEDDMGREVIGGIVSKQYAPLTHVDFLGRMLETPGFNNALVHRWTVTPARMDFTLLLDGMRWEVDGGIKCGTRGGNGQFGDKAAGLVAMLFRLLCTNGMMEVIEEAGFKKRHTGGIDLGAELQRVIDAAGGMFDAAKRSMTVEIDVVGALVELYRRGALSRGALRKCLERMDEVFGGVQVGGHSTTLWGLSQAITAAARDYSFTQMQQMGQLAGSVTRGGLEVVRRTRPLLDDRTDWAEVLSETGHVLAVVPQ